MCVLPGVCLDGNLVDDGTGCDDGDSGTVNDQCTAGVCAGEATGTLCADITPLNWQCELVNNCFNQTNDGICGTGEVCCQFFGAN